MTIKTIILGTVIASASVASADSTTLTPEQWLLPTQTIGQSCYYRATMQSDGNLVLTDNGTQHAYWATGTQGSGGYAKLQADGNFVVYNWQDNPVWTAWTQGHANNRLVMQDDGNLVVYNSANQPLWASGTAGERLGSTNCYGSNFAKTDVYAGWNAFGGDYYMKVPNEPRASWCAYFCSQDSRCKTFTYVPPGVQSASPQCWLKDQSVTWQPDSRMTSGIIEH